MAGLTYFTARQFILKERETAILRQAYVNASLARSSLRSANPNITQLLASLDTVPGSRSVLELKGQWYATSISVGENAIPAAAARPRPVGHAGHPTLRARRHPADGGRTTRPERRRVVLRGLLARRPEPDPAHPGPGPRRGGPVDHRGGCGHRAMGERPGAATAGPGVARRGDRGGREPRHPIARRGRRRALGPGVVVQPHDRRSARAHRPRSPIHRRREPRAPLPAHHPGDIAGRPRVAPRRTAAAQPSRTGPVEHRAPPLPAHGRRPPRDQSGRHRVGRALARRGGGG